MRWENKSRFSSIWSVHSGAQPSLRVTVTSKQNSKTKQTYKKTKNMHAHRKKRMYKYIEITEENLED